ncbi:MAG: recombinase family protein [Acidobacteria bacterium]|nr:recombinase family protein [Acidobacteriota bacterium]
MLQSCEEKFGNTPAYLQKPDVQAEPLRELARQRGWELHRVYCDSMSGTKEDRLELRALMADARRGVFQVVIVWRFDRFPRSVKQLVLTLEKFRALGIDFISHQEVGRKPMVPTSGLQTVCAGENHNFSTVRTATHGDLKGLAAARGLRASCWSCRLQPGFLHQLVCCCPDLPAVGLCSSLGAPRRRFSTTNWVLGLAPSCFSARSLPAFSACPWGRRGVAEPQPPTIWKPFAGQAKAVPAACDIYIWICFGPDRRW